MEDTRHERAALVVVSYFIGGITAFIGFSTFTPPSLTAELSAVNQVQNTASVISGQEQLKTDPAQTSIVEYRDGVLLVATLEGNKTLSFQADEASIESDPDFATQGTHVGKLNYTSSKSAEYVFFCEVKQLASDVCSPFVYDSLRDTIYPLKRNGERVNLLIDAAADASFSGNILTIAGESSADASKPWLLGR